MPLCRTRDYGRSFLVAVFAGRRSEVDGVIARRSGPCRRSPAGRDGVDAAAVVIFAYQTELSSTAPVRALDVDTAVTTAWTSGGRHVGHAEFDVQLEIAVEFLLVMMSPPLTCMMPPSAISSRPGLAVDLHPTVEDLPSKRTMAPLGRRLRSSMSHLVFGLVQLQIADRAKGPPPASATEEQRQSQYKPRLQVSWCSFCERDPGPGVRV